MRYLGTYDGSMRLENMSRIRDILEKMMMWWLTVNIVGSEEA